ncbi:MAG TPA: hypothetical protein HPQ03_08895 [Deltaproteobacteria bacterium]|nr:hypothetical protein [Deltaproteobacteria bacterium]
MAEMMSTAYDRHHISEPDMEEQQFHSVEFHVDGLQLLYQSKVWSNGTDPMFTLVKEDSDVLNRIQVGDILNMKFYSSDGYCPPKDLETEIKHITKDTRGRFKGHFLVGLAIVSNRYHYAPNTPFSITD